jgi:hypothetical protein
MHAVLKACKVENHALADTGQAVNLLLRFHLKSNDQIKKAVVTSHEEEN